MTAAAAAGVAVPQRLRWDSVAVLAAVAAVLIGAVTLGLLARPSPPGDGSAEAGFARDMSVHHAQAVEMGDIVRARTTDAEVRIFATDVVLTQENQIGQMRGWLDAWRLPASGSAPTMTWMGHGTTAAMPGMANPAQIAELRSAPPAQADVAFLRAMIPHHQAAVSMARAVLERSDRREVRRLAQAIIAAQQAEIGAMRDMLARRGASTVTPTVSMPTVSADGHHEGGFTSGVGDAGREALRLAPVAAAVLAGAWLISLAFAATGDDPRRRWTAVAATVALAGAGLLHLALAPAHFDESAGYGIFFVVVAVAQLAVAGRLLARPTAGALRAGGVIAGVLIAVYLLFRLVTPPGGDGPESFDAVGVATQILQASAVAAVAMTVGDRTSRRIGAAHAHAAR